ncbi:MAG: hypothetical protein ACYC8T_25105 [Myxococcaceae bacterium]
MLALALATTARAQGSNPDDVPLFPLAPLGKEAVPPPALSALSLQPSVGFGWSQESGGLDEEALHFRVGGTLEYRFSAWLHADVSVRDHFYHRTYLGSRLDLTGRELARVRVDEQKLDVDGFVLFDLVRLLGARDGRWTVALGAGPAFRFFISDSMPSSIGTAAVAGKVGVALTSTTDLSGGFSYAYNLLFPNHELLSALGSPRAATRYYASIGFRYPPAARLGLGYDGEVVVLQSSSRLYHTLALLLEMRL